MRFLGATSNVLAKNAPNLLPKCLGFYDDLAGPNAQDLGAPRGGHLRGGHLKMGSRSESRTRHVNSHCSF